MSKSVQEKLLGALVLTQEQKDWFGDGEIDVDLMLIMGAVSEKVIIKLWERANKVQERNSEKDSFLPSPINCMKTRRK